MYPSLKLDWLYAGLDISFYFLAIAIGFLLAALLASRQFLRIGIPNQQTQDFMIWMLIMGVVGSRVMHVFVDGFLMDYINLCFDPLQLVGRSLPSLEPCNANVQCLQAQQAGQDIGAICHPPDGLCYPQRDCLRPFKFWAGGLTVYGSLLACVAFAYGFCRKHGINFARIADICAPAVFFGMAIGRLGCLAAGCCYGDLCDIDAISLRFPTGSLAYQHHLEEHYHALEAQWQSGIHRSLPVWPTQLIDTIYNLTIFTVGYFVLRPRKRFHGQVILQCAILYGACRFAVEFLRADFRGGALGLSTSQLVSIPVLIIASVALYKLSRTSAPAQDISPPAS